MRRYVWLVRPLCSISVPSERSLPWKFHVYMAIAVFISGRISIDIIEKRAQRILDLFLRVQPQDYATVSFSMGISVTGLPAETFDHMVEEAEEAMLSARRFGPNRCRMYDEIKG